MAIDKGPYQAPQGIGAAVSDVPDLEIEIEDPEALKIHAGDIEIDLVPRKNENGGTEKFDDNLAEYVEEGVLETLGADLVGDFDKDMQDRREWIQTYVEGLKLLGLKYEERTEPWQGA